jgi:hypothetical protein
MHLGRIEFNIVLFTDWSFASGCSPPILSFTQLPSATDRPVLLSDRGFHPIVGAYFQAHSCSPSGAINYPKSCLSSRYSTLGYAILALRTVKPALDIHTPSAWGSTKGPVSI